MSRYLLMLDNSVWSKHATYKDALDKAKNDCDLHGTMGFAIYELVANAVTEVKIKMMLEPKGIE